MRTRCRFRQRKMETARPAFLPKDYKQAGERILQDIKKEFIEFMMGADVLRFGDFVTKSGRNTPYFINTGNYRTGRQIAELGRFMPL